MTNKECDQDLNELKEAIKHFCYKYDCKIVGITMEAPRLNCDGKIIILDIYLDLEVKL